MADDPPLTSDTRAPAAGFALGPGTILAGRYEILDYVGRGGMGIVYKAHDRTLDETVAIKILRNQPFDDPSLTQRFLAEIKLARRVTHKNVCRIHDYGEASSVRFISMQFVEGTELRKLIRSREGLYGEEGYSIALQLVDGLEAIHQQGIVHRDLKTSNVMIDRRGTALLMDFGIAKFWQGEPGSTLTAAGQIIGTPDYMSPEQSEGESLDPRSDIYSLGVVLFELFTAELPFKAGSFGRLLYKKLHEPLPVDSPAARRLPASLKPIIWKALAASPNDRYPSTRELRAALLDARASTPRVDTNARTTIGTKVENVGEATPTSASTSVRAMMATSRRRGLTAAMVLAAAVLVTTVVRVTLPLFRSASDQVRTSVATTTISPAASVAGRDSSTRTSNSSPASEPARGNPTPNVPSSTIPAAAAIRDPGINSCESGDAAACVQLGQAAEATQAYGRAMDFYLKGCNGKVAVGCTAVGVLYNRGLGVNRDTTEAAMFYERGCTLGDMAGCNNLGTVYQFGSIGFRDPTKAALYYERACSNGQMDGCANLGLLVLDTPGAASQEKEHARELLAKACAAGIARACGRVR